MQNVSNNPFIYTIVPVLSGGTPLPEVKKVALKQSDATKAAWNELTDAQRDNLECFDVVELRAAVYMGWKDEGEAGPVWFRDVTGDTVRQDEWMTQRDARLYAQKYNLKFETF